MVAISQGKVERKEKTGFYLDFEIISLEQRSTSLHRHESGHGPKED